MLSPDSQTPLMASLATTNERVFTADTLEFSGCLLQPLQLHVRLPSAGLGSESANQRSLSEEPRWDHAQAQPSLETLGPGKQEAVDGFEEVRAHALGAPAEIQTLQESHHQSARPAGFSRTAIFLTSPEFNFTSKI